MAYQQFGKTWWGQKWLQSLEHIDYGNRLPRGKSYARNDKVKKVTIKNSITAKVQGSRSSPYTVTISLPTFTKKQQENIIQIISNAPLIFATLLNKKLPDDLYDVLYNKGIHLFPSSWNDLHGSCSCPDWAVPCKHIAAVIFMVATAIDQNPEIVFTLHGMDIFDALEKLSAISVRKTAVSFMAIESWFVDKKRADKQNSVSNFCLDTFDVMYIPDLGTQLIQVLPSSPAFLDRDFKLILMHVYEKIIKNTKTVISRKTISQQLPPYVPVKPKTVILEDLCFTQINFDERTDNSFQEEKDKPLIDISWIQQLPLSDIEGYDDYVKSWVLGNYLTLEFLLHGAFIPRIIQDSKKQYRIQWIPAYTDKQVHILLNALKKILPDDLIQIRNTSLHMVSKEQEVYLLFHLFIQEWLHILFKDNFTSEIERMFFAGNSFVSDSFEKQYVPESIQIWLMKWHLMHREWVPVFQVRYNEETFSLQLLVKSMTDAFVSPIPLGKFLKDVQYKEYKMDLLQDLAQLTDHYKDVETFVNNKEEQTLYYDGEKFAHIFLNILPTLQLLGIPILFPKELEQLVRPKVSMKVKTVKSNKTYVGLDQMLMFDWQIALGNQYISTEEFMKLLKTAKGIVHFRDQFLYLNPDEAAKILEATRQPTQMTQVELLKISLSGQYEGVNVILSPEVEKQIQKLLTIPDMKVPDGLQATLRPYQERGWRWLYHNSLLGFGSLLADDMGLGKTIQIITLLLQWKKEEKNKDIPILIIVPTSLLTNWGKEIQKFAPSLAIWIYYGTQRCLPDKHVDVLLTTYGLLRKDKERFNGVKWPAIIIDEAQNIKNASSAQTKTIKTLDAQTKIALTGTPVENRLSEFWNIFDYINVGYLGALKDFNEMYAKPIEIERNKQKIHNFQKITEPFLLRRLKTDKNIIADLPEKISNDEFCSLTKEQTALYQNLVDKTMHTIEAAEGIERLGIIFQLMTGLKQICNHPAQYLKHKDGKYQDSGKVVLLFELLQSIYASQQKVLIFTQYTQMGMLLVKFIESEFNKDILFFHGALNRNARYEMVTTFQEIPQVQTMILSLKAGGTGLNLTAASHVIHFDLWWNPAVEAQATDRAYRIGQKSTVNVHRFVTTGTFEEKINTMLQSKKELADLSITAGEKWIGQLSNEQLHEIFTLPR